jgi:hypothetical protein
MIGPFRDMERSCEGESAKISDNDREEDGVCLGTPPPNLKGGNWLSGCCFCGKLFVLSPLARESRGRGGPDFRLSVGSLKIGGSIGESEDCGDGMEESTGVKSGVGDCNRSSMQLPYGAL